MHDLGVLALYRGRTAGAGPALRASGATTVPVDREVRRREAVACEVARRTYRRGIPTSQRKSR
jgi:hypothetical protein